MLNIAAICQVRFVQIGSMHFVELLAKDKHRYLNCSFYLKEDVEELEVTSSLALSLSLAEIRSLAVRLSD